MRTSPRLCLALLVCALCAGAVDWKSYRRQGCVNDYAGVIDNGSKTQLEQYCREVESAAGTRIVLVVLPSLEREPLADVAREFFTSWRDREQQPDRRVMVLLSLADRWGYVATGAGVRPGGLWRKVLRQAGPALGRFDYAEALRAAADTIGTESARSAGVRLKTQLPRRLRPGWADSVPWLVLAGAALVILVLMRRGNPAGYGGAGSRGLIPAWLGRAPLSRSTWGSRGGGGFGGFDSGDEFGGFGGSGSCRDW
jgi:uncharacterized protein